MTVRQMVASLQRSDNQGICEIAWHEKTNHTLPKNPLPDPSGQTFLYQQEVALLGSLLRPKIGMLRPPFEGLAIRLI